MTKCNISKDAPTIPQLDAMPNDSAALYYTNDGQIDCFFMCLKLPNGKLVKEEIPEGIVKKQTHPSHYNTGQLKASFSPLEMQILQAYVDERARLHTDHQHILLLDNGVGKHNELGVLRGTTLAKIVHDLQQTYLETQNIVAAIEPVYASVLACKDAAHPSATTNQLKYRQHVNRVISRLTYLMEHPEKISAYQLKLQTSAGIVPCYENLASFKAAEVEVQGIADELNKTQETSSKSSFAGISQSMAGLSILSPQRATVSEQKGLTTAVIPSRDVPSQPVLANSAFEEKIRNEIRRFAKQYHNFRQDDGGKFIGAINLAEGSIVLSERDERPMAMFKAALPNSKNWTGFYMGQFNYSESQRTVLACAEEERDLLPLLQERYRTVISIMNEEVNECILKPSSKAYR